MPKQVKNIFICSFLTCISYMPFIFYRDIVCVGVPEESNAKANHNVVERVEAHHAHQQILQNNLGRHNAVSL